MNNEKFIKNPNLKYKYEISNYNHISAANDQFEVFTSCKDNKQYIAYSNKIYYYIDIHLLENNKIIKALKGHSHCLSCIRYFMNNKNKEEYLISAEYVKEIVILWDITNNYDIKYKFNPLHDNTIFSCLLLFTKDNDNYIITSSSNENKPYLYVYSLRNGLFIKNIIVKYGEKIYYLLSWNSNNKYYIILFSCGKIIITNLMENELYYELIQMPEDFHYSGFIYKKNSKDFLCSSCQNGYINIWDLINKEIVKIINTYGGKLYHIIQWNEKYIIVADRNNKSFKIVDIELGKVISNIKTKRFDIICIKKIKHPFYGESLISAGSRYIDLWAS